MGSDVPFFGKPSVTYDWVMYAVNNKKKSQYAALRQKI